LSIVAIFRPLVEGAWLKLLLSAVQAASENNAAASWKPFLDPGLRGKTGGLQTMTSLYDDDCDDRRFDRDN
jgi:hypothetical protein